MCSWSLNSNDFSHAFQTATERRVACILVREFNDSRWDLWGLQNSSKNRELHFFYICFLDFDDHYISLYDPPWDFLGLKNDPKMGLWSSIKWDFHDHYMIIIWFMGFLRAKKSSKNFLWVYMIIMIPFYYLWGKSQNLAGSLQRLPGGGHLSEFPAAPASPKCRGDAASHAGRRSCLGGAVVSSLGCRKSPCFCRGTLRVSWKSTIFNG